MEWKFFFIMLSKIIQSPKDKYILLSYNLILCVCVYKREVGICVCVCMRERGREGAGKRETES